MNSEKLDQYESSVYGIHRLELRYNAQNVQEWKQMQKIITAPLIAFKSNHVLHFTVDFKFAHHKSTTNWNRIVCATDLALLLKETNRTSIPMAKCELFFCSQWKNHHVSCDDPCLLFYKYIYKLMHTILFSSHQWPTPKNYNRRNAQPPLMEIDFFLLRAA